MHDELTTGFEAEIYLLSTEEGGRRTPIRSGYSPQWNFGRFPTEESLPTYDVGEISLVDREQINPGESCSVRVRVFSLDEFTRKVLAPGFEFEIFEGSRMVGKGTIERLI